MPTASSLGSIGARFLAAALLAGALLAPVAGPARAAGDRITVFAAASLGDAMAEIEARFEAATGHDVSVALAGSSVLAAQIRQGAPADVFLSASPAWMDALAADGLLRDGTRRDLLNNSLVLIAHGPDAAAVVIGPGLDLAGLLGDGRLAMALVDAVPAGLYGRAALESLGLWDAVADRVAQTDNVRAALALVALGEARFGIVFAFRWTDAALAAGVMAFPLMVRAIRLSIEALDPRLEQASATLGAAPVRTVVTVTLPMALPGSSPAASLPSPRRRKSSARRSGCATIRVRIAAQEVILSRARPQGLSALNILCGTITDIRLGAGPGVLVTLAIGAERVTARRTRRSADAMALARGQTCHAVIKAVAVAPGDVGTGGAPKATCRGGSTGVSTGGQHRRHRGGAALGARGGRQQGA